MSHVVKSEPGMGNETRSATPPATDASRPPAPLLPGGMTPLCSIKDKHAVMEGLPNGEHEPSVSVRNSRPDGYGAEDDAARAVPLNGVMTALAALPRDTVVTLPALAKLFGVHPGTIMRAVRRGDLPAPTKLFGKSCWTVGAILRHLEVRQEIATRERQKHCAKASRMTA